MYNSLKKIAILPIVICLLSSCASGVKINTFDKSYETDTVKVNAQIPQISGLSSCDLEDACNEEILSTCLEHLNSFEKSAKESGSTSVFDIETTEHYNRTGFLSLCVQIDSSVRKSSSNRIVKNIDTNNGIEVSLSDLFSDDAYIDAVNALIQKEVSDNKDTYSDLWEKPKISQNQCFFINDEKLVLFYPPYELSYYERGFVEIAVPLDELSGYLKPEYRKQFLGT